MQFYDKKTKRLGVPWWKSSSTTDRLQTLERLNFTIEA